MNDANVYPIGISKVLQENAYMLFYVRQAQRSFPIASTSSRPAKRRAEDAGLGPADGSDKAGPLRLDPKLAPPPDLMMQAGLSDGIEWLTDAPNGAAHEDPESAAAADEFGVARLFREGQAAGGGGAPAEVKLADNQVSRAAAGEPAAVKPAGSWPARELRLAVSSRSEAAADRTGQSESPPAPADAGPEQTVLMPALKKRKRRDAGGAEEGCRAVEAKAFQLLWCVRGPVCCGTLAVRNFDWPGGWGSKPAIRLCLACQRGSHSMISRQRGSKRPQLISQAVRLAHGAQARHVTNRDLAGGRQCTAGLHCVSVQHSCWSEASLSLLCVKCLRLPNIISKRRTKGLTRTPLRRGSEFRSRVKSLVEAYRKRHPGAKPERGREGIMGAARPWVPSHVKRECLESLQTLLEET